MQITPLTDRAPSLLDTSLKPLLIAMSDKIPAYLGSPTITKHQLSNFARSVLLRMSRG
jgi:hypothetical protein